MGRTGLRLSAVGLGCGGFGGVGTPPELIGKGETEQEAFAILDRAVGLGIDHLDTSDSYAGGESERIIGRWLRSRGGRDRLVIATKVRKRTGPGQNDEGLSRRHVVSAVEASLRRLGCDWIDLYALHEPDPRVALEETLRALDDLVTAGKVRYVGASNFEAWRLCRALWISDVRGWVRFESLQARYSLLERGLESELLPLCADQRIGVVPYQPLAGGLLTGKYRRGEPPPPGSRLALRPGPFRALTSQAAFLAIDRVCHAACERGVAPAALALAWVVGHPQVTSVLIGPRRPEHLDIVDAAVRLRLDPGERERLGTLAATAGPSR